MSDLELNDIGIYIIINKFNGKSFIGSTAKSFKEVWDEHKKLLEDNDHPSSKLQHAWSIYGSKHFEFKILEVVPMEPGVDDEYLDFIKKDYLDILRHEYNI